MEVREADVGGGGAQTEKASHQISMSRSASHNPKIVDPNQTTNWHWPSHKKPIFGQTNFYKEKRIKLMKSRNFEIEHNENRT